MTILMYQNDCARVDGLIDDNWIVDGQTLNNSFFSISQNDNVRIFLIRTR